MAFYDLVDRAEGLRSTICRQEHWARGGRDDREHDDEREIDPTEGGSAILAGSPSGRGVN